MSGYGALVRFFSTMSINKVYLRLLKMCLSVGFFSCCREVGKETGDKALFFVLLGKLSSGRPEREAIM